MKTLGIVAGNGRLPELLVEAARRDDRPFYVVSLQGQGGCGRFDGAKCDEMRVGAAGGIIKLLKQNNVEHLVMAGGVRRPSLASLRPDLWTTKFLAKTGAMAFGDDGLLRRIVMALEEGEGFEIVGAHDVAPELLASEGVIAGDTPTEAFQAALSRAIDAALDLGRADKGQAAVASYEAVLALEGAGGTARMLQELEVPVGTVAVLAKMPKPGQERRIDLPAIGPDTVDQVADAGLVGLAVEAGGALVLDLDEVKARATARNVTVFGLSPKVVQE